jgi:hypothetical protein
MSIELQRLHDLYVGQLTQEELDLFNAAVREGKARRVYTSIGAWLMDLPSVAVTLYDGKSHPPKGLR